MSGKKPIVQFRMTIDSFQEEIPPNVTNKNIMERPAIYVRKQLRVRKGSINVTNVFRLVPGLGLQEFCVKKF